MKIGIYDPYLDSLGGGERYMLTIAQCLAKDNDVTIFWNDKNTLQKATEKLGLKMTKIKISENIFASDTPIFRRLLETQRYDRIFFLSNGSVPISLAKKTFLHFQFPLPQVKGKTLVNRLKFRKISGIFCNSYYTKKFIDKTFGIHSRIIYPPCIPDDSARVKFEKKKNYILTVGRYNQLADGSSFKKHEVLIHIFRDMIDAGLRRWQFIVVTSFLPENEKYIYELEKIAKGYPIKILKNIPYTEINKLYALSKIYWHAAGYGVNNKKTPELVEHFGITTVEAMRCGVIPVVIKKGGHTEIISDGKNGFLWETKDELIKKTRELMNNHNLRKKIAQAAIKRSADFTVGQFCREIMVLIA